MNEPARLIERPSLEVFLSVDKTHCILAVSGHSFPPIHIPLPESDARRLAAQLVGNADTLRRVHPDTQRKPRGDRSP